MESERYNIPIEDFNRLQSQYPNKGKNGDISKIAVEVVKLYFQAKLGTPIFKKAQAGGDIIVGINGIEKEYEIKGTEDYDLSFSKLKVSSQQCHDALEKGMLLIRVTNLRQCNVMLHFLKCGVDFTLHHEPRWSVKQLK